MIWTMEWVTGPRKHTHNRVKTHMHVMSRSTLFHFQTENTQVIAPLLELFLSFLNSTPNRINIWFCFNGSVHHYYTAFAFSCTTNKYPIHYGANRISWATSSSSDAIALVRTRRQMVGREDQQMTTQLCIECGFRFGFIFPLWNFPRSWFITFAASNAVHNSHRLGTSLEYLAVNHLNKTYPSKPMNMKLSRLIDNADIALCCGAHRMRTVNALKI